MRRTARSARSPVATRPRPEPRRCGGLGSLSGQELHSPVVAPPEGEPVGCRPFRNRRLVLQCSLAVVSRETRCLTVTSIDPWLLPTPWRSREHRLPHAYGHSLGGPWRSPFYSWANFAGAGFSSTAIPCRRSAAWA